VTLIGTPSAVVSNATTSFFADVTQPPGSLPGNRTDYVSTAGTPYAAAYDATHNLIFSSNPDWNRIDVISNATHKIIKSIPVRSPRGLDITQDNSHVWVQTASQNIYAINTTSLQANQYALPNHSIGSSGLPAPFAAGTKLLALSDGTLFLFFNDSGSTGGGQVGVWNPQTNQLNVLASGGITAFGVPVRSGDGTRVYASNDTGYKTGMEVYNTGTQSLTTINSGTSYGSVIAVNQNGSELILATTNTGAGLGIALYDHNLSLLGAVPGALRGYGPLAGGVLFSGDNTKLYEVGFYNGPAVILTIDALSLKVLGTAPSVVTDPVGISGASATASPFAIDAGGTILGLQRYGISFDDSTFYQNYAVNQPPSNGSSPYTATYAGPLAGGTVSSLYAFPALTPDVWFGQTRGSANLSQGQLQFTSPPSTTSGPVNVKFIYPDGNQVFYPQLFSYSTFPQYAVMSGSSPNGGAPAQVIGYGLPADASGGTLTVGANAGRITTTVGQYPPFSGEPYPSAVLAYTFPPGTPGWADLQITTPIGTGTLPKSIFYAKSVTDYSSSDTFTAVLVDEKRKQVYLAAGDHVDVFSTLSNQFVTPLHPASLGSQKQFTGLALTPGGSQLLVTDLLDGSLAVINPDNPSSTYAIVIAPLSQLGSCPVGPLYVAATSANQAFVSTGSLPAPSCPAYGNVYLANLATHTATLSAQCSSGELGVDASGDGNFVAIGGGPCIYSVQSSSYASGSFPSYYGLFGIAISADGNVIGYSQILGDLHSNMLGSIAVPTPFYGNTVNSTLGTSLLLRPRLNASGSLYYFSYPKYFEIIDVAHATLRMRFSLTETIQNTASPLAIDSGGRHVYLLTDKGLTVVDFGAAPLSIGHLSPQNASPGSQIVVRGSGFDSSTTATVGGVSASVSVADENTLTLTVPAAPSGPQDIVFTRSDGETYTLENGAVLP
jgi:IPT/TIG domain